MRCEGFILGESGFCENYKGPKEKIESCTYECEYYKKTKFINILSTMQKRRSRVKYRIEK